MGYFAKMIINIFPLKNIFIQFCFCQLLADYRELFFGNNVKSPLSYCTERDFIFNGFICKQVQDQRYVFNIIEQFLCLLFRQPYGTQVAKAQSKAAQQKLTYRSVLGDDRDIPAWIDDAIKKAVHIDPYKRYQQISEFIVDMRRPNRKFLNKSRPPLMEQNPLLFWKSMSFILLTIIIYLLSTHPGIN